LEYLSSNPERELTFFSHDPVNKVFGAQVLSQLIWVFDDRTPEESVTLAISTLDDYCNKSAENVEDTVSRFTPNFCGGAH